MTHRPLALALLVALALPAGSVEAREAGAVGKPQSRAIAAASEKFSARMNRLDALMGEAPARPPSRATAQRSRSADAER